MFWLKKYAHVCNYKYVSTNQHGDRFKRIADREIAVALMEADINNANDLRRLILLSHHLDVPVHYDFDADPRVAFIEVVAKESLTQGK